MGATVDAFKATHQTVVGLLKQIDSTGEQQRVDALNSLKKVLLAHVCEENNIIKEAMDKPDAEGPFKSSAQRFMGELGDIAQTALLPFFGKYSSSEVVGSNDFANDFCGIKSALADRIAFEEGRFYPELEKLGF
jgi:Hemerythrin HHE cation binding domain.